MLGPVLMGEEATDLFFSQVTLERELYGGVILWRVKIPDHNTELYVGDCLSEREH